MRSKSRPVQYSYEATLSRTPMQDFIPALLSAEEELDQKTARLIARSLQGRAGRQRTVLEPLENVPTLVRAAPKP
jgi:hypothetical protein